MIITENEVKESMMQICQGCEYFTWDVYGIAGGKEKAPGWKYLQITCKHEELCSELYKRANEHA